MTKPKHPHPHPHPHPHGETKKQILSKLRLTKIALAITLALLMAAGVAVWQVHEHESERLRLREEAMRPPTGSIGGPFTLTDQDNKTVRDIDYRGKYLLVYFGYTYCPDLCPTGLQGVAHVLDQLENDEKKVQAVFITIDPARDTPDKLKEYVSSFHPDIVGLTGTADQISAVAREYQVYYARGENVDDKDYLMDHSTLIYVMDPDGKFVTTFPDDTDPVSMVTALRAQWNKPPAEPAKAP